ncbi:hypothetical protein RY975_001182 [Citrobacter braakii]|nr:hypothetical protein [Citrobacter braakii]
MRLQESTQPAASSGTQSGSNPHWRAASPGLFTSTRWGAEHKAAQIEHEQKHGHISLPHESGDEAGSGVLRESISMKSTYEEQAVQLANAESKCRELAGESAELKSFIVSDCHVTHFEQGNFYDEEVVFASLLSPIT